MNVLLGHGSTGVVLYWLMMFAALYGLASFIAWWWGD